LDTKFFNVLSRAKPVSYSALAVELVHGRIAAVEVDEAGGVAQQVRDGHRALLRLEREPALSARRIGGLDTDHHVLELGKILVDRGGEIELSLLDQHHGGHARDRLGHRGDPEDCVRLQRHRLGAVAKADRSQVGDLAVARDRRNRARERAGIDLRLLPGGDPCQS
jgi:hypothetical protein